MISPGVLLPDNFFADAESASSAIKRLRTELSRTEDKEHAATIRKRITEYEKLDPQSKLDAACDLADQISRGDAASGLKYVGDHEHWRMFQTKDGGFEGYDAGQNNLSASASSLSELKAKLNKLVKKG